MTDFRIWRWGDYPQLSGWAQKGLQVYREEGRQERQRRKSDDRRGIRFREEFEGMRLLLRLRKVPKEECRIECPQKPK